MFRKPLLAFTGVAALSALAFAPLVNPGTVASADGKARAAAAGSLAAGDSLGAAQRLTPAGCVAEMAGPFNCNNVDLVDNVPTPLFGGEGHGSDSWGWTDDNDTPDDPSDDTDYVIVTSGDGHGFFRLADDGSAQYLGTLQRAYTQDDGGTPVLWNDVKVVNDHAYITAEDSSASQQYGIQIVDLSRIAELGPVSAVNGLRMIEEDGHLGPNLAGHNLVAFDEVDVLGVVLGEDEQCGGQLVFFDVADTPTQPERLGCVDSDLAGIGNVPINDNEGALGGRIDPHDAHCVVYAGPDADYNGAGEDGELGTDDDVAASHVCALFGQESGGLILVDVSDITRDRTVDVEADGGRGGAVINRFTYDTMNYAHQGWFTDDHEFVMFGDELDESGAASLGVGGGGPANHNTNTTTYWVDVSDLDVGIKQTDPTAIYGQGGVAETQFRVNEELVRKWSNPNTLAIDHNMYPVGNYLYQANYGAGLRVLKFTPESLRGEDPTQAFEEVAYFDTYPGPGPSEFYGAWNVFPFFGQDRIILSDFQAGLLVLDVHDEVFESDEG